MSAALQRRDDVLGMEAEWRGDDNCIDVSRLQQATMIAIDRSVFAGDLSRRSKTRFVNVAQSGHAHAGNAQEISHQFLSTTARANNPKPDLIRWCDGLRLARPPEAATDDRRAETPN
jgi:hypothetical protein